MEIHGVMYILWPLCVEASEDNGDAANAPIKNIKSRLLIPTRSLLQSIAPRTNIGLFRQERAGYDIVLRKSQS